LRHIILRNGSAGCSIPWLAERLGISEEQVRVEICQENAKDHADGRTIRQVYGRYRLLDAEQDGALLFDRAMDAEIALEAA
jgi:hypothetical protein